MKLRGKVDEMREVFLSIVICGMGLILIGKAHAADTDAAKGSPAGEQQIQGVKEKDEPFEQIQEQYIARLKKINTDLRNKHSALVKNYSLTKGSKEKMNSNLEWGYGNIPSQVLRNLQDLSAEKTVLEASIQGLEKEKADLRSDVISFYGGKVPERLSQQWDNEEKAYKDYVDTLYLQVQWSMESPKWEGERKAFRDYILEYYRLRQ